MGRVEQEPLEGKPADLETTVNSWLYKVERESLRTSSSYEQGLDILCRLVSKPDYKTLRQSLEAVRQSEEVKSEYHKGEEVKAQFRKSPGKINSALLKIDPHLCGDSSLLYELFIQKRAKLKFMIDARLKALKKVGLNEENPQYPYLLGLAVETAARGKMFGPLINKVSSWTGVTTKGDTVELSNPQLFFTIFLKKTEYWRGFSDVASENVDQYANSIFGEDAEKAKFLWKMLWLAKFPALRGKNKITSMVIEKVSKPLIARNWEEAEKALSVMASYYPEIFNKIDLEQLGLESEKLVPSFEKEETARREKEESRAKKRKQINSLMEFARSNLNIIGHTRGGETVIIQGTKWYVSSKKEYLIIRIPWRKGQKTFHFTPETFLARLQSGEYIFSDLEIELEK